MRAAHGEPRKPAFEADLAAVEAAWPTLDDPIKAAILAMIRAVG